MKRSGEITRIRRDRIGERGSAAWLERNRAQPSGSAMGSPRRTLYGMLHGRYMDVTWARQGGWWECASRPRVGRRSYSVP